MITEPIITLTQTLEEDEKRGVRANSGASEAEIGGFDETKTHSRGGQRESRLLPVAPSPRRRVAVNVSPRLSNSCESKGKVEAKERERERRTDFC